MINILVLEDDVKLNQIVCTYLNDSGFHAKGCLNANAAYDEMYNNLYELIISDIMMPGTDGFEFAENVPGSISIFLFYLCRQEMIFPLSKRDFGWELTITW